MCVGAAMSVYMFESDAAPGAFVGALLSMSSTSIVVKCLEASKSMFSSYGTITVGTLILQDCWVGLLFALLPLFRPQSVSSDTGAGSHNMPEYEAALPPISPNDEAIPSSRSSEAWLAVGAVMKVLQHILLVGGSSLLLAHTIGSHVLSLLMRRRSVELCQIVLVGFCLGMAWAGGEAGISCELGAFLAGLMVSVAAGTASQLPPGSVMLPEQRSAAHDGADDSGSDGADASAHGGSTERSGTRWSSHGDGAGAEPAHRVRSRHLRAGFAAVHPFLQIPCRQPAPRPLPRNIVSSGGGSDSDAEGTPMLSPMLEHDLQRPHLRRARSLDMERGGSGGSADGWPLDRTAVAADGPGEQLRHTLRHYLDSVTNTGVALFIAATALIISPVFLWQHVRVLAVGTALVMVLKAALVSGTVRWFGHSWRTSVAIGLTLAHVGEFAFVLLSMSSQLQILQPKVYQLLLGITALSLLVSPLVILLCGRLLRDHSVAPRTASGRVVAEAA
mmetsp:Transcript_9290/g.28306  ORF Transcript_9290/g.28306 Transcript_9290/m.28306 type:complete len:502 (-) Transcript_9290:314-1819(-)